METTLCNTVMCSVYIYLLTLNDTGNFHENLFLAFSEVAAQRREGSNKGVPCHDLETVIMEVFVKIRRRQSHKLCGESSCVPFDYL